MKPKKMNMMPINGNVLLRLPELKKRNENGIVLTDQQQYEVAVNATQPFEVLFADPDTNLDRGDQVYMSPAEFTNPQIVEYSNQPKMIVVTAYQILGIRIEEDKKISTNVNTTLK